MCGRDVVIRYTYGENLMKLLRVEEVTEKTGLSRTTIWRKERAGEFPQRVRIGPRSVAWREQEVEDWIESRPRAGSSELA